MNCIVHGVAKSQTLIIREMQIKITVRYHFTLTRMAIIKNPTNNKPENLQRLCRSCHMKIHRPETFCVVCGEKAKGYGYCDKHLQRYKKCGSPYLTKYDLRKGEEYCKEKIRKGQSDSSLYHLAGDSITTTVIMAIFGELTQTEYWSKIQEVADDVSKEQREKEEYET